MSPYPTSPESRYEGLPVLPISLVVYVVEGDGQEGLGVGVVRTGSGGRLEKRDLRGGPQVRYPRKGRES